MSAFTDQARSVTCPVCDAEPGQACFTLGPNGTQIPFVKLHHAQRASGAFPPPTPTSNAGQSPARVRVSARFTTRDSGSHAQTAVTADNADRLWREHAVDYPVSGDQSLRAHGYLGIREAGRPGAALVTRARHDGARRAVADGWMTPGLTAVADNQDEVDASIAQHEQHLHDTNPE